MVWSKRLDEFDEESGSAAAADGAHEAHGQEFRRETNRVEDWPKKMSHGVDATRGPEHENGRKHADDVRDDHDGDLETFFRAVHKFFVDLHPPQGGVEGEKRQQKRQRQNRDSVDPANGIGFIALDLIGVWDHGQIRIAGRTGHFKLELRFEVAGLGTIFRMLL